MNDMIKKLTVQAVLMSSWTKQSHANGGGSGGSAIEKLRGLTRTGVAEYVDGPLAAVLVYLNPSGEFSQAGSYSVGDFGHRTLLHMLDCFIP